MIFTTEPSFKEYRTVTNINEAEDAILHITLMTWSKGLNRMDVTITLPNGVSKEFVYHRGDSLINFIKKLFDEAQKHL